MPDAVIVDVVRTPIGRAFKGSLAGERAEDLGAFAIKTLVEKYQDAVAPEDYDEVIFGVGFPDNEQGYNVGRNAWLLAGYPESVPGHVVSRFCASSVQSIRAAANAIQSGDGEIYLAGGLEASSRAGASPDFTMHPKLDGSEGSLWNVYIPMGMTAENVADKYGVTREAQDEFAARSQQLAVEGQENGFWDREITPYTTKDGVVVAKDDGPRAGTTVEKLAGLNPVFKPEGGTVTAGNACPLNDGAAAALIMSADKAAEIGLKARAKIIGAVAGAVEPEYMGVGPIPAVEKLFKRTRMTVDDIDLFEINEAFAAQVLPSAEKLNIPIDKVNVQGGAIAVGHPFGMTGARIMGTLLNNLETNDKQFGLETMCVAGGQGMAIIVERLN
ncbi:MAG: acetyl-CoA C-acyltransferase [Solirubrobacterales bacterium]|nr:acetyl-CoA C-acyltransferase [Solirubrobacterales bacterium]